MWPRPIDAVRPASPLLQVRHHDDDRPYLVMPSSAEREALFERWSATGDKYLSMAEVERAVDELWPQLNHRKVIALAYRAADVAGDKLIDRRAFYRLLQHAVYINDRYPVLDEINSLNSGRVSSSEFRRALPALGIIDVRPTEANAAFVVIDEDSAGFILFEELCEWAARRHAHASPSRASRSRSRSPSPVQRRSRSRSRSVGPRRAQSVSPRQVGEISHSSSGLRLDPVRVTLDGAADERRHHRRATGQRVCGERPRAEQARGGTPLLGRQYDDEDDWSSEASYSSDEEPFLAYSTERTGDRRSGSRSPDRSDMTPLSRAAASEARGRHRSTQWNGADFSDWPPSGRVELAGGGRRVDEASSMADVVCLCCCPGGCALQWDPSGEFEPAEVATSISALLSAAEQHPTRVGTAGFPPPGDDELLTLRQGRVLMQQMRTVGWLQRAGAVGMRQAAICDVVGLSAGVLTPLTMGLAMSYLNDGGTSSVVQEDGDALVYDDCSSGAVGTIALAMALSVVAAAAHAIERIFSPRAQGLAKLAVAEALHAELKRFVGGVGKYKHRRSKFTLLLERLEALRVEASGGGLGQRIAMSAAAAAPMSLVDPGGPVGRARQALGDGAFRGGIR